MPVNFVHAGLILLMLPGAKLIHCRRNAVDTCLSCYSKIFTAEQAFTYDQTELGAFHRDYQRLAAHWRDVLPAESFLEIDYEAVVADLDAQARRLLAFLNLPWNDAVTKFHQTKRPVRTASVNQVRRPVYASSAGRGRAHEAQLGALLAALPRLLNPAWVVSVAGVLPAAVVACPLLTRCSPPAGAAALRASLEHHHAAE